MISIRRRLTRSLLLALVGLMLAGGFVAYYATRAFLLAEFDSGLKIRAQSLLALVEFEEGRFEVEYSEEFLSSFHSASGFDSFEVRKSDGEVLARSRSLHGVDLPRRPVAEDREEIFDLPLRGGRPGRALAIAFRPRGAEVVQDGKIVHTEDTWTGPPLELVLALDRRGMDSALGSFARGIALMEVVLLVAVLVLVRTGIRHGLAPLDVLAAEVDSIDEASLDHRLGVEGQPAELAGIRRKLDQLLGRLQLAFERERRFSSAAAHELRTPIAELRALTEVALKWPEERSDAERNRELGEVHAIARQMEQVVGALLAIARNGHGEATIEPEPLDLAPIVDSAFSRAAEGARTKRLEVSVDVPDGTAVSSVRVPLETLLRNLAENAFEYAPPESRVTLSAKVRDETVAIEVTNADSTLTEADLPHLFEPFWRKDDARTDARHSGLGLAVCETLARAIGASIGVRLDPPGHVTFTLVLARAAPILPARAPRAAARA
jgi:signal transduction histidine kinase